MIHKIHTPRPTFKSIIKYVCEKKDSHAEILGGNMPMICGKNPTQKGATGDLIKKFQLIEKLNPDRAAPVFHSSISLKNGEHLTNEQWLEVAEKYLTKIGIDIKTQPFFITKHTDTENEHIHLVVSQTNFYGKNCWLKNGSFWRGKEACRELEKEYGLGAPEKREKAKKEKSNKYEKKQAARKNQKETAKEKIQNAIDEITKKYNFDLKTESGRNFFKEKLNENEILVKYTLQQNGAKLTGMAFSYDGQAYSGTKLGTEYKTNALIKRALGEPQKTQTKTAQYTPPAPAPQKREPNYQKAENDFYELLITFATGIVKQILIWLKRARQKAEAEKRAAEQAQRELQKQFNFLSVEILEKIGDRLIKITENEIKRREAAEQKAAEQLQKTQSAAEYGAGSAAPFGSAESPNAEKSTSTSVNNEKPAIDEPPRVENTPPVENTEPPPVQKTPAEIAKENRETAANVFSGSQPIVIVYNPTEKEKYFLERDASEYGATLIFQMAHENKYLFAEIAKNVEKIRENNPDAPILFLGEPKDDRDFLKDTLRKNQIARAPETDFFDGGKIKKAENLIKSRNAMHRASAEVDAEIQKEKERAQQKNTLTTVNVQKKSRGR